MNFKAILLALLLTGLGIGLTGCIRVVKHTPHPHPDYRHHDKNDHRHKYDKHHHKGPKHDGPGRYDRVDSRWEYRQDKNRDGWVSPSERNQSKYKSKHHGKKNPY